MSAIAEKIFDEDRPKWLASFDSIEKLLKSEDYWVDENFWDRHEENVEPASFFACAYFVISNPEHPQYDNQFTRLECEYEATSISGDTTRAGFIVPEGEAGRVVLLPREMNESELKEIMPDIIFDLHKLK